MRRRYEQLEVTEEQQLQSLIGLLGHFHEMRPGIPLAVVQAFLLVCLHEGASLRELCQLSGQPQSTLSRHLLDLGQFDRKMEPGLKLVAWRHPPEELRRKEYYLTPRGSVLRQKVLRHLDEAELTKSGDAPGCTTGREDQHR